MLHVYKAKCTTVIENTFVEDLPRTFYPKKGGFIFFLLWASFNLKGKFRNGFQVYFRFEQLTG